MKEYYSIREIMPGFYRIRSDEGVYSELLTGSRKAMLIDTGYGFGDLSGAVRGITDKPLIIVNTHGHLDHCWGNYQFRGPVYINEKDWDLMRMHTGRNMRKDFVESKRAQGLLPEGFNEAAFICGGSGELVPLNEGDTFDLGGITLEAVALPGHTGGSMGLIWKEEKVLFSGDAMNAFLWLWADEALMLSDYVATLRKAGKLDISEIVQSHNPRLEDKSVLSLYLRAAAELDFEKGVPFKDPLIPEGIDVRVCALGGNFPCDPGEPGFAAIVISKAHIDK